MGQSTFNSLNIHSSILQAITEMGFTQPTEIQEKTIPLLSKSNIDFIGQAQTGTGKTAAFVIPLLEKINSKSSAVQALVLAPTRELANQVENEIVKLGKYTGVRSTCVYGGASYDKQLRSLKNDKPQIVVGTPGRVIDLLKRGALNLENAKCCVLDEADEMLNMGFFEDVQIILDMFNEDRQLIMFSATMPRPILNLIKKSSKEYEMVKIEKKSLSNEDIEQKYFVVENKHFKEALARLIDIAPDMYGIVFCRTRLETKDVGENLRQRGHRVEILNGDMGQTDRDHAMKKFKERRVNIMVCTDVAARGIDVNNLTHVFNYGLPQDNESYVHRIGRTGRAGMKGKAYTIVGPKMTFAVRRIEKHINNKITLDKLPSVQELKKQVVDRELERAQHIIDAVQTKGDDYRIDETFMHFYNQFKSLSKEELLKTMFSWKFNRELKVYNDLQEIEKSPGGDRDSEHNREGHGRRTGRGNRLGADRRRSRGESRRGSRSESDRGGFRGESSRGSRSESDRGFRGESSRGSRAESDRGFRGESSRGSRSESERGSRGESSRGSRKDSSGGAARGSRSDSTKGSRSESARGSKESSGGRRSKSRSESTQRPKKGKRSSRAASFQQW